MQTYLNVYLNMRYGRSIRCFCIQFKLFIHIYKLSLVNIRWQYSCVYVCESDPCVILTYDTYILAFGCSNKNSRSKKKKKSTREKCTNELQFDWAFIHLPHSRLEFNYTFVFVFNLSKAINKCYFCVNTMA